MKKFSILSHIWDAENDWGMVRVGNNCFQKSRKVLEASFSPYSLRYFPSLKGDSSYSAALKIAIASE